ncbi:hypothetical protein BW730_14695 [Tessaracoccus aquimaris]|uniref:Uncharacterized protein n=1 Tax=Tessaracoccus aquimaris TaxID=1332264 RepID=A0A1Q2CR15_9ACTN|nr:SpaH/EbpB family LPXTG-anchored major pilin [Tessaracoccus aquimaris]AQP48563.1 hypothetical protein BW730_14695 [Tessaracoccus aquimaris]
MFERKSPLRRLAAGMGAFALAVAGLLGTTTAQAAPVSGNIDTTIQGNLFVHKHVGDPGVGTAGTGEQTSVPGKALEGVTFTIQRVLHNGTPVDLTTSEGWDLVKGLEPDAVDKPGGAFTAGVAVPGTTKDGGTASFVGLEFGMYLVKETDSGLNNIVSKVAPFLVSVPFPSANEWLYDVHVYPKNVLNETEPTKTVADPGHALVVGSTVDWTVTAPVPTLATGDSYKEFVITDTFDERLSIAETDVTVTIAGVELVAGDYTIAVGAGPEVVVTFTDTGRPKLVAGKDVVVTYATKVLSLGDEAFIANIANVNTNGTIRYTNEPAVWFGSVKVTKVNAASTGQTLAGAEFELYDAVDGKLVNAAKYTTDANGAITIDGLWGGKSDNPTRDYWLKETKAPAGYVTPADDAAWIKVTVTADATTPVSVQVENAKQTGPTLPLTGGVGAAIFGGTGLAMVLVAVGAITVGAARRRQSTR